MTNLTLICKTCGQTARRPLENSPSCRGVRETRPEPALCPAGHGPMVQKDLPQDGKWTALERRKRAARLAGSRWGQQQRRNEERARKRQG